MTFTLDAEMAAALAPMAEAIEDSLLPAVGDVAARRATFEPMMGQANGAPHASCASRCCRANGIVAAWLGVAPAPRFWTSGPLRRAMASLPPTA